MKNKTFRGKKLYFSFFNMSIFGRQCFGGNAHHIYKTTFLVPMQGHTHHIHFSLGPRIEGSLRTITFETHPIRSCTSPEHFSRASFVVNYEDLVFMNFPIDQVTDWTPEEASIISFALCPETKEHHDRNVACDAETLRRVKEFEEERKKTHN
jgi:hypothetical protein